MDCFFVGAAFLAAYLLICRGAPPLAVVAGIAWADSDAARLALRLNGARWISRLYPH